MEKETHIVLFSGGEGSAIEAVECVRRYGKEHVILLNDDINPRYEIEDIKRFKREVANYLGLEITYCNYNDETDNCRIPSQFEVCIKAGAITSPNWNALCTAILKTEPFERFLAINYPRGNSLFWEENNVVCHYGFSSKEIDRMQRRTSILGIKGYKTDYVSTWKERTIHRIEEIGIKLPASYEIFLHANCIGCLKASLLHWYCVYVHHFNIYEEGIYMEDILDFTIHTIIRNKIKRAISLKELIPIFQKMYEGGIEATEKWSSLLFAKKLRKYEIEECEVGKPCECLN